MTWLWGWELTCSKPVADRNRQKVMLWRGFQPESFNSSWFEIIVVITGKQKSTSTNALEHCFHRLWKFHPPLDSKLFVLVPTQLNNTSMRHNQITAEAFNGQGLNTTGVQNQKNDHWLIVSIRTTQTEMLVLRRIYKSKEQFDGRQIIKDALYHIVDMFLDGRPIAALAPIQMCLILPRRNTGLQGVPDNFPTFCYLSGLTKHPL